jgi:hypothetical protein
MKNRDGWLCLAWVLLLATTGADHPVPAAEPVPVAAGTQVKWTNAPWSDPGFFPLAVWLQDPANAKRYRQILELAPVLNSPTVSDAVAVRTASTNAPVAVMTKHYRGSTYVFAVAMRDNSPTEATFNIRGATGEAPVNVLGENRDLRASWGEFSDRFDSGDVHLYRLSSEAK